MISDIMVTTISLLGESRRQVNMEDNFSALIIFLIIGLAIVGFVSYIMALVNAAKTGKWTWFVLMLLFWPFFIFYYMGAYTRTTTTRAISGR